MRKSSSPGRNLRKALLDAKQFRAALEVHRDLEPHNPHVPEVLSNGGFEELITLPVSGPFGWTLGSNVQSQISIFNEGHSGLRSLQIVLSATTRLDRINASQTIAVQPNTQYRLEYYARTDRLSSASTPVILIVDGGDNQTIATTASLPTGTNGWQKYAVDFKTRNSDGLKLIIACLPCSVGDICPIFGTVWYDDFILQRASGGPGRVTAASANQETSATAR